MDTAELEDAGRAKADLVSRPSAIQAEPTGSPAAVPAEAVESEDKQVARAIQGGSALKKRKKEAGGCI